MITFTAKLTRKGRENEGSRHCTEIEEGDRKREALVWSSSLILYIYYSILFTENQILFCSFPRRINQPSAHWKGWGGCTVLHSEIVSLAAYAKPGPRAYYLRSNCHSWASAHHLCALSIELREKVVETVRAMHRSLCRAVLLSIRISSLILCIYYITLFRKSQILFPHSYAGSTSHQGVALTTVRRLSYWR